MDTPPEILAIALQRSNTDGGNSIVTNEGVSRRKGIGFAIAQRFAMLGADVFVHSFLPYDANQSWGADTDGIPALIAELQEYGTQIAHAEGDFLDPTAHLIPRQIQPGLMTNFTS